jgi:hypothetical protein
MNRVPTENAGNDRALPSAAEKEAFRLFCARLAETFDDYLGSPTSADVSGRARLALNALNQVAEDLNQRLRSATSLNRPATLSSLPEKHCMITAIARIRMPEELELENKKAELRALQSELCRQELKLATLQAELRAFQHRYLRIVGVRYAELDRLEAQIAETLARRRPTDDRAHQRAAEARATAEASAQATGDTEDNRPATVFQPSESLKKLYRETAKRIYPDLTTDPTERLRRNDIMARANRAYEEGDESTLRAILNEWESGPDSVNGDGPDAELARVIRKIHQAKTRLCEIATSLAALKQSQLYQLKQQADRAAVHGRDLLREMADRLEREIQRARNRLSQLSAEALK